MVSIVKRLRYESKHIPKGNFMATPKLLSHKDSFLTSLYLLVDTWPKRGNSNG